MPLISDLIRAERQRIVDAGEAADFAAINSGLCGDFADQIVALLQEADPSSAPEALEIVNFFQIDPDTGFAFDSGGPMDRAVAQAVLPEMMPPDGMTWDEFDIFLRDADVSMGLHVFVIHEGMVYDSELPEGGRSIFDLPFFQRFMERSRERASQPAFA